MSTPQQRLGDEAEQRVEAWLAAQGLHPIDRNVRSRFGEIDLVMSDQGCWVFVEVRLRTSARFGGAAASVDWRKQQRILRTAQHYLQRRFGSRSWPPCRFDVVAIEQGRPDWVRGAFGLS
jgi:putative endonuclease